MEKHLTSQSNVIPSAKGRKQTTNESYLQGPTYQAPRSRCSCTTQKAYIKNNHVGRLCKLTGMEKTLNLCLAIKKINGYRSRDDRNGKTGRRKKDFVHLLL